MREFVKACWPCATVGTLGIIGAFTMSPLWVILTALMCFDIRTRWKDYNRLKKIIVRYGPDEVYLRVRRASWCQRTSTIAAFAYAGHEEFAIQFYDDRGYRFWHIFPDGTFSKNCTLIDVHFWGAMINKSYYTTGSQED